MLWSRFHAARFPGFGPTPTLHPRSELRPRLATPSLTRGAQPPNCRFQLRLLRAIRQLVTYHYRHDIYVVKRRSGGLTETPGNLQHPGSVPSPGRYSARRTSHKSGTVLGFRAPEAHWSESSSPRHCGNGGRRRCPVVRAIPCSYERPPHRVTARSVSRGTGAERSPNPPRGIGYCVWADLVANRCVLPACRERGVFKRSACGT